MTRSQSVQIQFLETQPGFHRNKVPGFKEAVGIICNLPVDEGFSVRLLEDLRQFQGFHIIQFSKIISLISRLCVTLNFQCEVEKFLQMCQHEEMADSKMDISVFMAIVLDILSSKEATENTVTSLDSTLKELETLHNELAGAGAFNLGEIQKTNYFFYNPENYHPSSNFLDCYNILKQRSHQENGRLLINSTVSLIRVEKDRKARGNPYNWAPGLVLRAWLQLLRTSYVSNNLAILIAEMERDHCDRAVKVGLVISLPILPAVVAAIDKLNIYAKDHEQAGDVIVEMMRVPGSFDTDLSGWTETPIPRAQMEERWKMFFMAAGGKPWSDFPLLLTQLLLKTSLPNGDFDVLLQAASPLFMHFLLLGRHDFVYLYNWIVNNKKLCTSTMAVVNLLRTVSLDNNELVLVLTCLISVLKSIDCLTDEGVEQGEKRNTDIIRMFTDLRVLFLKHNCYFLHEMSNDLVKCCTGTSSAEERKLMVDSLLSVVGKGVVNSLALWGVLVTICCNERIVNKAGLWNKYLDILPSLQWREDVAIDGTFAVLEEENAFLLLNQILPVLDFLSRQVSFFHRCVNGDVDRHFSLVFSIIQMTDVKTQLIESLARINIIIESSPRSAVIPGCVYDTLVVAVAGTVVVGTHQVMMDYHVCRCVARALYITSEPIEVLSMYFSVKVLLVSARKPRRSSFHGQPTPVQVSEADIWMDIFVNAAAVLLSTSGSVSQKMSFLSTFRDAVCRDDIQEPQVSARKPRRSSFHGQPAPVQVSAADIWMDIFVNAAAVLLSTSGSVSQKMSLLSTFHDAVCRDDIQEPQELQNAIANCISPFEQTGCDEYRNSLFQCTEEMLNVHNILKVLGRVQTEEVQEHIPPTPLTSLILAKFPETIKCKGTFQVYRFLAGLADKYYLPALLRVFPAALKSLPATQDVLDELQILANILMTAPPAVLPLVADWLVASYNYNVSDNQRETFVKEIVQVQSISVNMHNLLQTSKLFVKGWQKTGDVQGLFNKLFEVLRHVDEDFLTRHLSAPTESIPGSLQVDRLSLGRERAHLCEELHWLLLETDLSPSDIALCIRLTLPTFGRDVTLLQVHEYSLVGNGKSEVEKNNERNPFRSSIRVAHAFLLNLRCNLSIEKDVERLLETLLRAVLARGSLPPCCDKIQTREGILLPGRPRTTRESVSDALNLITLSKSESELVFWLETPRILTCGQTMNVVLETCKWRRDEQDTDDESRMDINCRVGSFLQVKMTGLQSCCVGFPIAFLPKLLQLNLNHKLMAKLLDLHLLNEELALACGSIVSKWQSSEGLALLEKFISLWSEKRKLNSDLPGDFEITCFSSILRSQPVPESAERVVRLCNELHARRMLGEHHPLHTAACWSKEVSPLRICAEVTAAWLAIFYTANVKWHDVSVITALTPAAMDLLIPGSTCIEECLFTSHTVNKILMPNQEGVNEKELKFALTLARLLNDFLVLAQRLKTAGSPNGAAVVAILQDASCKLCMSFSRYSRNCHKNQESIPHLVSAKGQQSADNTHSVAYSVKGPSFANRHKHPDSQHSAAVPTTFLVQGAFSNCLNTGDGTTISSLNRGVPIIEDITLKDDVGQCYTHGIQHQNTLRAATRELHKIRRQYVKKVLIEMYGSNESDAAHAKSMLEGKKNSLESVLLLMRRWLATTASLDTDAPVLKGHMDKIFSLIVHGNHPHSSETANGSPCVTAGADTTCKDGTQIGNGTQINGTEAVTETATVPVVGELVKSWTQTATPTPVQLTVAATAVATTVSHLPSGPVGLTSLVDLNVPNHNQVEYSSVLESSTLELRSPKKTPKGVAPNFREDECGYDDDYVAEYSLSQMVQDYVINLADNQSCIARLQRSGYNQCESSDDRPLNLWCHSCIKLSGIVRKRQEVRDLEETSRLHNICNGYLDLLIHAKVESVDINGESLSVRNLFDCELPLNELNQQIAVVRQRLQVGLKDVFSVLCFQGICQREAEFRRGIKILRGISSQETQEKSDQRKDAARTFSIVWENRFFEAIKLCSENIPGCYAPNGFYSHKPIQCALCADSRIISVFEESGNDRKEVKEVENVEVKLLEAGMFVYDLYSGQLEMATDELWAAFYKFLLEKRLVPKIILSRKSPAFRWAKRLVGSQGEEDLDGRQMKFHETVIPMQESHYEYYPNLREKNGKDVYTAALTLTTENVKRFVFSDLQLLDPSATNTKEGVRKFTRDVMNGLRCKLLDKFQESNGQLLLGRLGHSVTKVCGQVIRDNLSTRREMTRSLEVGIDKTKLWKDIEEANKVGVQWFLETIVDLIILKKPKQDT